MTFLFGIATFDLPLLSWTFYHGKWKPQSSNGHGEDYMLSSYSQDGTSTKNNDDDALNFYALVHI